MCSVGNTGVARSDLFFLGSWTLKLPIKMGYHPIILGVQPIFKGILEVRVPFFCLDIRYEHRPRFELAGLPPVVLRGKPHQLGLRVLLAPGPRLDPEAGGVGALASAENVAGLATEIFGFLVGSFKGVSRGRGHLGVGFPGVGAFGVWSNWGLFYLSFGLVIFDILLDCHLGLG